MYNYIPYGLLCAGCKHKSKDCSSFDFSKMFPIKEWDDGYIEVRCKEFDKEDSK